MRRRDLDELLQVGEPRLVGAGPVVQRGQPEGVVDVARAVGHQVLDPQGLHGRPGALPVLHLQVAEGRDVLGHGIVPLEQALLVKEQHRDDRDGLAHRPDREQRVAGDGRVTLAAGVDDTLVQHLSVVPDAGHVPARDPLVDERLLDVLDVPRQRRARRAALHGHHPGRRGGPGTARGDEEEKETGEESG